jgi:large subunit ribosomal protein L33
LKTTISTTYTLITIDQHGIEKNPRPGREGLMAKHNDVRPIIKLRSTAGTGFTYVTRKNRRNDPDRLAMRKYDPVVRHHVDFREER